MVQFENTFLGIQGYPEFNNEFFHGLMTTRSDLIADDILKVGYDSLAKNTDHLFNNEMDRRIFRRSYSYSLSIKNYLFFINEQHHIKTQIQWKLFMRSGTLSRQWRA